MIQPIGFHLCVSSDWLVDAVSANIGDFLPCSAPDLLGQPLTAAWCDDAIHDVRNRMALLRSDEAVEHLLHVPLITNGKPFDLSISRDGDGFAIDAEPSDSHGFGDATGVVEGILARLETVGEIADLGDEATRLLRALTGFDRAIIVGNGQVLGEAARTGVDRRDHGVISPATGDLAVVDCTACGTEVLTLGQKLPGRSTLRFPTDEEIAGMTAIGVRAALIVPLKRDGRSWGYIGCFHAAPRHLGAERRNIIRLFARIIALRIEIAELRRR